MAIRISERAEAELDDMPASQRSLFIKHIRKVASMPPRRHMKYGIPYHVEEVTKQARLIYHIEGDDTYILHCFKTHKEYERWYTSYK